MTPCNRVSGKRDVRPAGTQTAETWTNDIYGHLWLLFTKNFRWTHVIRTHVRIDGFLSSIGFFHSDYCGLRTRARRPVDRRRSKPVGGVRTVRAKSIVRHGSYVYVLEHNNDSRVNSPDGPDVHASVMLLHGLAQTSAVFTDGSGRVVKTKSHTSVYASAGGWGGRGGGC